MSEFSMNVGGRMNERRTKLEKEIKQRDAYVEGLRAKTLERGLSEPERSKVIAEYKQAKIHADEQTKRELLELEKTEKRELDELERIGG